jgi:hypothetical protein
MTRLEELREKLRQRVGKPGWNASATKIKEEIARLEAENA